MDDLHRVRWSCRRGLLELDLVLEKFVNERYAVLDDRQKEVFGRLLRLPDNDLLDLAMGRAKTSDEDFCELVELMRS